MDGNRRVIFTVYIDLGSEVFNQYKDKLIQNKEEYCEKLGYDFFCFEPKGLDYIEINNYKHIKMRELADEYDEVLYLDLDVVCNTEEDFFEAIDLSNGICYLPQTYDHWDAIRSGFTYTHRSPTVKWKITSTLLNGKQDIDVINTGIMGGKSEHIKKLDYSNEFPIVEQQLKDIEWKQDYEPFITPNNEAIFSYLLHKNEVPFQILPEEWHHIRNKMAEDKPLGKFVHFINKCFWDYFKDKSCVIFSLYVDIPDDRLDNSGAFPDDNIDKSMRTKLQMNGYYDQLLENQAEYARKCGVDYIHVEYSKEYEEFRERCLNAVPDMSEYNVINFYKIWLLEKFSKQYDFVLYLDFDVCVNTDINYFNFNNLVEEISVFHSEPSERTLMDFHRPHVEINYRSPTAKYWNAHAMLFEEFLPSENFTFNTGIVGVSKETMEKLAYFDNFEETLELMTHLKEDSDSVYPKHVQECFGYDNETVFSFKVQQNGVPCFLIDGDVYKWHFQANHETRKAEDLDRSALFIHFINKRFEWFFTQDS